MATILHLHFPGITTLDLHELLAKLVSNQEIKNSLAAIAQQLAALSQQGTRIEALEVSMSASLDALVASTQAENTVIDGAVAGIAGLVQSYADLAEQLRQQGIDTAQLDALNSNAQAKTQALADAIATLPNGQPAPNPA